MTYGLFMILPWKLSKIMKISNRDTSISCIGKLVLRGNSVERKNPVSYYHLPIDKQVFFQCLKKYDKIKNRF